MAPADEVVDGMEVVGSAEGVRVSVVIICVILVRVSPSVVIIWTLVKVLVSCDCVVGGGVDVVGGGADMVELVVGCG